MNLTRTEPVERSAIRGRKAILHRVLGALFVTMAAFQLADLPGFVGVLRTFQLGGAGTAWMLVVVLLTGELVSGIWLLGTPGRRPLVPAVVFAVTAVIWSALATQAFARGLALDNCGCFGVYLAQRLRWWVLLEDVALLGYATLLIRAARTPGRHPPRTRSRSGAFVE
ncbi:MAG: MauE/DoxX family redox-associated membrane protein [Pseudonocardiaceae bacterium]